MIALLIDAAVAMDEIFWIQAYGDRQQLLDDIEDPATEQFALINYGPWDRLAGNEPFLPGVGPKPAGSNFYPRDVTRAEMEREIASGGARADSLRSLYTLVRRDQAGRLTAIPYHVAFRRQNEWAAARLRQAAELADDRGLRRYLTLRADALQNDQYRASDLAWMDMKNNSIDVVIGPIETYEDALFGFKAANEAFVLIKDREWSGRLERYVAMLPFLQQALPVPAEFKRETPGTSSDLNAYDAVYYGGDANAGSKTIAINLPNDETVQLERGTRRLQIKNAVRAKFDRILLPIARELIAPDQLGDVTFDAFFENTMFHEVAHGLGIKNTVFDRGTVREALKERGGGLEEEKADVLGLFMIGQLTERGELPREELMDNYVTFLAGIFRTVRFGASSAHAQANMATFNFFREQGAFTRDAAGKYRVDLPQMQAAVALLSERILRLQGTGDYTGVGQFMGQYGTIAPPLQADLDRLSSRGIPVDIIFEQGPSILGL
ncbi:MAG: Zn-dependent hydrolase [Gemmatimonadetes bacterium]|nr:Zn-dependent hydrolase [Gemmatimonadota bacterium]